MNVRKRTEEVLAEHSGTFIDQDGDQRCECGKWLEPVEHEWPHHVAAMLDDAGVLDEEKESYGSPYRQKGWPTS